MSKNSQYITNSRGNRPLFKISLFILILILMLLSFGAGLYMAAQNDLAREVAREEAVYLGKLIGKYSEPEKGKIQQDINFELYWDLWDTLKENYVDSGEITDKKLFYGSLKGMTEAVGDPYTVFMDPQKSREFEESMTGTFEGIGAEVGIKDEILTIIAPLEGMPAEEAGLKAGDKVLEVDGESTEDMTLDEAVNKIRGEEGTEVVLTIFRKGEKESREISITRGVIHVNSINTKMREDGIYEIEVTNFNSDTLNLFNKAVEEALDKKAKGIILDLRNNPGGYLTTSIEVASEWVESGLILSEKFSSGEDNEYKALGRARLSNIPTVVLVNLGSASASEIVAGALQAHDKAVIIGEQTFGKGSIQSLSTFGDGSSAKITVAKWFTPGGRSISEEGIAPDIKVEYTLKDYENENTPQKDKAIEVLNKIIAGEMSPADFNTDNSVQATSTQATTTQKNN